MGGGDLNLKKSWHPHTLKNQERLWKAEQAKSQEDRKLKELRREIDAEKSREDLKRHAENSGAIAKSDDKKLEWMYKNSTELINREEYLLGRKVDNSFERLVAEEKSKQQNGSSSQAPVNHIEYECIPVSIRSYKETESAEQVDLQRKIMEDPLMLIKQKEIESRKKLLENPVKLKELHRILKSDTFLKEDSKRKKPKKSHKKKKKHSKNYSRSNYETDSNSSEDLDSQLAKRYQKLKGALQDDQLMLPGINLTKMLDNKYDAVSKELNKALNLKKPKKGLRSSSRSSNEEEYKSSHKDKYLEYKRRNSSRSPDMSRNIHKGLSRNKNRRHSRSRSPSPKHRCRETERRHTPSRKSNVTTNNYINSSTNNSQRHKLSEEEKEKRRREMMENAAWREADRYMSVKKQRDAYALEEADNKKRDFDKNFINKEVKKAIANQTSVESRIRANLNNIQRSSRNMNENFARK